MIIYTKKINYKVYKSECKSNKRRKEHNQIRKSE